MPFITPEDRDKMNKIYGCEFLFSDKVKNISVGDRCYYFYKKMVKAFKGKNRRWTTAHNIYKKMVMQNNTSAFSEDTKRAYELAWQVFFQLHVMPYEIEKQDDNGDVI